MQNTNKTYQKNIKQSNTLSNGEISTMPPHDTELELDVLADIAFNPDVQYKINTLGEYDFYSLDTKKIYNAFVDMYKSSKVINISVVDTNTKKTTAYLSLTNRNFTTLPSQLDMQIKKLKEYTSRRLLQNIAYEVNVMVVEDRDVKEIKNFCDDGVSKITLRPESEITNESIDGEFEKYLDQKELPLIKTGFPKLDNTIGGFMKGTYSIIAAAQSIGKTSIMINFMVHMCQKGKKILHVSLDTNFLLTQAKIISNISGVSFSKMMFKMKELTTDELKEINNARAKINYFKICRLGQKEINTNDIRAKLREEKDIDIVMIDYLQILKPVTPGRTLYEITTNISKEIKTLANESNIPFLVISSINRDYSDRADFKPQISDLRGSGSIEYDADLIMLMHRESAYRDYDDEKDSDEFSFIHNAELMVAKNRFGESNLKIDLYFDKATSLLRELAEREVRYENGNKGRKDIY